MKAVVCRVDRASVWVADEVVDHIEKGLLVYVGVMAGDTQKQARWLANKLVAMRLFADENSKMNLSVADVGGGLLLIPNFTLASRTKKGNRPSFTDAAEPVVASLLFDEVVAQCYMKVKTGAGVFGAHMMIDCRCDGPITVMLDSE